MVSKWEAGGTSIKPRPLNQAALDTSLAMASSEVKQRFGHILADFKLLPQQRSQGTPPWPASQRAGAATAEAVRHPLDGKLMTLIEAGPVKPVGAKCALWLPAFYIDAAPTTTTEYQRFLDAAHPCATREDDTLDATTTETDLLWVDDEPVFGLTWEEVNAYARWADKQIPTATQWERVTRAPQGIGPLHLWEWCQQAGGRPTRHGPQSKLGGFRTATPAVDMHTLLAI
jgi:formylglycine-generating enzyme required for sulfatase activity